MAEIFTKSLFRYSRKFLVQGISAAEAERK
jgi:hypothetical protein